MKYTKQFFKESMPLWKRKKDPILTRIFYRPLSFSVASMCANIGISANTVSFFSALVALAGCSCFLVNNVQIKLLGAILVNVWLLLDCVDGNLARGVKKQAFGEFADSVSSYILVGLLGVAMGFSVYQTGGFLFEAQSVIIVFVGALAGSSDSLMRLIYQKYCATSKKLSDSGYIEKEYDKRTDEAQVSSFRVRVEADLGIGGILPILVLLGTAFNFLDIVVLYCFAYYGLSCVVMTFTYIKKAITISKVVELS